MWTHKIYELGIICSEDLNLLAYILPMLEKRKRKEKKKNLYEKYLVAIDKDKIITKIILNHVEQGNPINSRKNTYPKNKIK